MKLAHAMFESETGCNEYLGSPGSRGAYKSDINHFELFDYALETEMRRT